MPASVSRTVLFLGLALGFVLGGAARAQVGYRGSADRLGADPSRARPELLSDSDRLYMGTASRATEPKDDWTLHLEIDPSLLPGMETGAREARIPSIPIDGPPGGIPGGAVPAPAAPAADPGPSSTYTVESGQGMGHVAGALYRAMEVSLAHSKIPEIWVPQTGGLIGLPHVIACYNKGRPDAWNFQVGEVVAFPDLDRVWPMVEAIKELRACPPGDRLPRKARAPGGAGVAPLGDQADFAAGAAFEVESGRTYSHYGSVVQREYGQLLPKGQVPPLYPAPGRPGIMNLLACWNRGDPEDLTLQAGRLLRVPPAGAVPLAFEHMKSQPGTCPPGFRAP